MNRATLCKILREAELDPRIDVSISQYAAKNAKVQDAGFTLQLTLRGDHRILRIGSWKAWEAVKTAWEGL